MNRRLKWLLTALSSTVLFILSGVSFSLATDTLYHAALLKKYFNDGSSLEGFGIMLLVQALNLSMIGIIIPLIIWWKEE